MTTSLKQIEEQALALNPTERLKLAQRLLKSVHSPPPEDGKAFCERVRQRMAAIEREEDFPDPVDNVFADIRRT